VLELGNGAPMFHYHTHDRLLGTYSLLGGGMEMVLSVSLLVDPRAITAAYLFACV